MFTAEDYQSLFAELGGTQAPATEPQQPATPQAPADPTPSTEVPPVTPTTPEGTPTPEGEEGAPTAPEAQSQDPAQPTAAQPVNDNDQKQARAFAEMRSTIGKYQKVFKRLQPMMGVNSEDEVIERLLSAGLNVQARAQNVDPSLLKRMQDLEDQNVAMIQEQKRQAVVESFGLLQKDFNLTNEQVIDFAKELDQKGIDLFKVGVDISTLYRGLHHDDITKQQLEAEKQKWIAEGAKADKAPGITTSSGKKSSGSKTTVNTMGELENLFNSLDMKN